MLTSLPALIASSGFWAYIHTNKRKRSAPTRLLMGLAYDKIVDRGMAHIDRGYITEDELSDFMRYLYLPYKDAGGNGVADRIMEGVKALPLKVNTHPSIPVITTRGRRPREPKS